MHIKNKALFIFAALYCLNFNFSFAEQVAKQENSYPDYAYEFLGEDKYENFNRKIFIFNSKLNKYVIRPVHITWASIMPKYGMDRLQCAFTNIEYPKRLASTLIQKDFKASKTETVRFLTNTTLGIGGLYDPAQKIFKIEPVQENMEQALAKVKVKQGPYLVIPVISSTTPRDIAGRLLECPLDPSLYVAVTGPIMLLAKTGLHINRTSYMQPMIQMVESTFADPYDVAKKYYAIENYIKNSNLDREGILDTNIKLYEEELVKNNAEIIQAVENDKMLKVKSVLAENQTSEELTSNESNLGNNIQNDKIAINDAVNGSNIILTDVNPNNSGLYADMMLFDYHPQSPVADSMRTALFDLPGINDSMWTELSVWNRCFSKQIKTSSVNIDPLRENYNYKYILQKDKTAPVAIIYPSIGEGVTSHHSVVIAKLFYDEGYSVIIQGSHFQWEFVKSMPKDYRPGIPSQDADYLKIVTSKIINSLQAKYNCQFSEKVVIGTSFGAVTTLFLADKEYKNNTMNITKYISINPPIEMMYAMQQLDKNNKEWNNDPSNLKERTALTAAKVLKVAQMKDKTETKIQTLPFSEDEAKLITAFIMQQKLSDLIFTIENTPKSNKTDIYKSINNISYRDYVEKYLLKGDLESFEELNSIASLHSISDFLKNSQNYKIYHTLDDYFVNQQQLKKLKEYSGNKVVLINNGAHLGFLYRPEFINELKKDIALKEKNLAKVSNK